VAALVSPRLEVVADRRTVHAVRFGLDGQFDEFTRPELLRRRPVSKFQNSVLCGVQRVRPFAGCARCEGYQRRGGSSDGRLEGDRDIAADCLRVGASSMRGRHEHVGRGLVKARQMSAKCRGEPEPALRVPTEAD
jgi:hypothetical protein